MEPDQKPPMPRRPTRGKPETLKPLRKKDQASPAQTEAECLTLTEEQEACLVLAVRVDRETAAIQLNMTMEEVNSIVDSAGGRRWLEKFQDQRIKKLATISVQAMVKVGVNKAVIEQRLMHLMMMEPSETGGKMDGQVKAASLLLEKCGYGKEQDPTEGKTTEELREMVLRGAKFVEAKTGNSVN